MTRPNILILYTDQQRFDALGCAGNREIKTPHLDALAERGMRFSHHFVQSPVCMPSRASFLTGQYPSQLHIPHMGVPLPPETLTLPRMLKPYGYYCANIGKLHFVPHANRDHRVPHPDYGFDEWEISDEPGCYEDAHRAWVRANTPADLPHLSYGLPPLAAQWQNAMNLHDSILHPPRSVRDEFKPRIFEGDSNSTHTAFVASRVGDFLRRRHAQPFLCIAGFFAPHAPLVAPREFYELYERAQFSLPNLAPAAQARRREQGISDDDFRTAKHGYYALVSEVDFHVGRILQTLHDTGLDQSTLIVFTSDHGEFLGDFGRFAKDQPGHECISRVPLIISAPAGIHEPNRVYDGIVEAVDVVPTLLECAQIPILPHLSGRSLAPALRGEGFEGRVSAILEGRGYKTLRTATHRYVLREDGSETLWDLTSPHGESYDVSHDQLEVLAHHRHEMARRCIANERALPRTWGY